MLKRAVLSLVVASVSAQSIATVLSTNQDLTALYGVVSNGNYGAIVDALSGPGNFTLFAPINAAWAGVNTTDVPSVTQTLYYHVLGSVVLAAGITTTPAFPMTLMTDAAYVNKGGDGQNLAAVVVGADVMINAATVAQADIICDNGVIHIIDAVLSIPDKSSEVATNNGLTALVDAVVRVSAVSVVDDTESITIFAPTNAAFAGVPNGTTDAELLKTLQWHIVPGTAFSTDLSNDQVLTTSNGVKLTVTIADGDVFINGAKVSTANVITKNAVVHVIDSVIMLDIANRLSLEDDLSSLYDVVTSGPYDGIVAALAGPGTFTLFAPKNSAWVDIPVGDLPVDQVTATLMYHALGSTVMAGDISASPVFAETLLTNQSYVLKGADKGQVVTAVITGTDAKINDATVTTADIMCNNGVIHIVDTVLTIPILTSATATANGLTKLVAAVVEADLVGVVDGNPSLTIFAPLDAAFDATTIDDADLDAVLKFHVVGSTAYSTDLTDGQEITTLEGGKVKVQILDDGTVMIGEAKVVIANVITKNAVVHVIDAVLKPSGASALQPAMAVLVLAVVALIA